jgi:hypothetical protein
MRRVHSLFEIEFQAGFKLALHLSVFSNFSFLKIIQYHLMSFTSEILSPEAASNSSLFLETRYPGKVTTCYSIHPLSLSQYSIRSNQSGHVCCLTIMKHFQHHLVCAINWYTFCCCRLQRCLCLSSPFLGIFLRVVRNLFIYPAWETLLLTMLPRA